MNSCLYLSSSKEEIIRDVIASGVDEDPFYVVDIQDILDKHKNWLLQMTRIKPYYAVKCNNCPLVLELLAALGLRFDCASKAEIDTILDLNVSPSNIIFANPCKANSAIKHAADVNIDLMTFDNELELYKVARYCPQARMILRIKVDDSHAYRCLNSKFGAGLDEAAGLLDLAKTLSLTVVGVSFHVGSGCKNSKSYADAIAKAKYIFNLASEMNIKMSILDIGGGFPGAPTVDITFQEIAKVVNVALNDHFPESESDVTVIAEPGRYYVASSFSLATHIIAKRLVTTSDGDKTAMYYLNDGIYGSFNCNILLHSNVFPSPLKTTRDQNTRTTLSSTLFGPTCDGNDYIKKNVMLPEMDVGEWTIFKEMGAYTLVGASVFNGCQLPVVKYFADEYTMASLRSLLSWPRIRKHFNSDDEIESKYIFNEKQIKY